MRIKKLTLYTSRLKEQLQFYHLVLGFEINERGLDYFELIAGETILRFEKEKHSMPYHFAFNIPSNQIEGAAAWLKDRVALIKDEGSEIIHFENWKAKACYFYDVDGNILEFIARKPIGAKNALPFSCEQILSVSEIGMPVWDISPIYEQLSSNMGLRIFSGNLERFCALGNDHGLFVIINKAKKKNWFPTNETPYSANFKVVIESDNKYYKVQFLNENLLSFEVTYNHDSFPELV